MAGTPKGSKTIRVSAKVVKFIQDKMLPLSGMTASTVIEEHLGLNSNGEQELRMFYLVNAPGFGQTIVVDSVSEAMELARKVKGIQITPVREVRTV